jgi:hypothetical protein
VTWQWEYDPDEQHVAGGAPPAFLAEVEKKADELVRAAEAFYLDGTTYQGEGPNGGFAHVPAASSITSSCPGMNGSTSCR